MIDVPDDDLDCQAGEYVLGTLDAGERSAFAARLRQDGAARRAVEGWDRRFAALAAVGDEAAPGAETWARIAAALRERVSERAAPRAVAGAAGPDAILGATTGAGDPLRVILASRDRWRAAAVAAGGLAAALLLAAVVIGLRPTAGDHRILVAAVNRGGDKPALMIRVDLATRRVVVRPVAAVVPAGRSLQLWAIDAAGAAPRSMGLVAAAPADLAMPAGVGAGASFAVSVEPEGGSRTGGPTGPVVYAGQLVEQ